MITPNIFTKQMMNNFDELKDLSKLVDEINEEITIPKQINTFYQDLRTLLNIRLVKNYLDQDYSEKLFDKLKKIKYNDDEQSMVKMGGMFVKIPRKQVAYGEKGVKYKFSGISVEANDWNKDNGLNLKNLSRMISKTSSKYESNTLDPFNFVLINNYVDNTNGIGYHSDDESELKKSVMIAGLSLGQNREICFRSKKTKQTIKIMLPHNSLIIIYSPTNKFWEHAILKTTKKLDQRISLTFRHIV